MKTQNRLQLYVIVPILFCLFSCNKDMLDRPPLTTVVDENFWRNETDIRLYTNGFYENYFIGYNTVQTTNYAPYVGSNFSDNLTRTGVQTNFESIVPTSRSSTASGAGDSWLLQHGGPTWNFFWVRKANVFIDRLENQAQVNLTEEEFNHWLAVGRFFRGFEYSRLVSVFGDVPYFDRIVEDNDLDYMYKDRDDRGVVMDHVYDDFEYVLENMRLDDGKQVLNQYIAAAFISRLMLFEGTFLHYHNLDATRAEKYLALAVRAAEIVMDSGQYSFTSDYKSLFASENLDGNNEVLMWRTYDNELIMMHSVLARQNGGDPQQISANLDFVKSFLCVDGQPYQNSSETDAASFAISDLVQTRDSRFEATFLDFPHATSQSLFYIYKHAPRDIKDYLDVPKPQEYAIQFNTTDAPIIRLAEVVLNWIEAKTVLAENYGGAAITQGDLDNSINAIRSRPIAAEASAKGVQQTAPLSISAVPIDPDRDSDVSPLLWEIRRERRVEFFLEQTRLLDLKRWKKMQYMNYDSKPENYYVGAWVDVETELPQLLTSSYVDILKVQKEDGTIVTYNGSNASQMEGYFVIQGAANREDFGDKVYLAPVGEAQIVEYDELGYTLTQTVNW